MYASKDFIMTIEETKNKSKQYRGCPTGRGHVERKRNHLEASKQTLDRMHVVGLHQPETYKIKIRDTVCVLSMTAPDQNKHSCCYCYKTN